MSHKKYKILVTSGGTVVKIDDVRHVGNFSTGSFPSKIAEEALSRGHEVFYLRAKTAKQPAMCENLRLVAYETYDDYARELKKILEDNEIDIVFLGAAVSDYGLKPHKGKISSSKSSLTIKLFRLPKIIKFIKGWSKKPFFQVGFKLLSNVPEQKLIDVGYKSELENRSDLIIANDLAKIKAGKREVILITAEKGAIKMEEPDLSKKILDFVEKRIKATYFKTVVKNNNVIAQKYKKEISLFAGICKNLSQNNLMPYYFKGTESGHGSLSLRADGNSFLITARSSNKRKLKPSDVVLVKKVDWKNKTIFIESMGDRKASFNAVLVAAILEKMSKVNAVVHTHSFADGAPTTSFAYVPGTAEYIVEPVKLLKQNRVINLKDHGLIAIGDGLTETTNYVLKK